MFLNFFKKKKETRRLILNDNLTLSVLVSNEIDSTVLSAVKWYSNSIMELPLYVVNSEMQRVDHPLNLLLIRPSSFHNRSLFFSRMIYNYLMHGASYVRILSGTSGMPSELFLYWNSSDISPFYSTAFKQRTPEQKIYYRSGTDARVFASEDMLIIREDLGQEYLGQSRLKSMNEIISSLKQKTVNQIKFGFNSKGLLTGLPGNKAKDDIQKFQKALSDFLKDESGFNIMNLRAGQELKNFQVDTKPESFVILRKHLVRSIYGLFNVPQVLSQDHDRPASTYKIMHEALSVFIKTQVSPILSLIESEFSEKLLNESELMNGYRVHFNLENLLKGDIETQYKNLMIGTGQHAFLSANEARMKIGMRAIEGGDQLPAKGKEVQSGT